MTKTRILSLLVVAALASSGCRKKVEAPPAAKEAAKPAVPASVVEEMAANFGKVHFETDKSDLGDGSKAALDANAALMKKYPQIRIEVQGHADERGTTDYNVALGDRRAKAVQTYLRMVGVSPERVNTLSFGEEKPAAGGHDESAWSQNRRAEFRILTGPANVKGTTD